MIFLLLLIPLLACQRDLPLAANVHWAVILSSSAVSLTLVSLLMAGANEAERISNLLKITELGEGWMTRNRTKPTDFSIYILKPSHKHHTYCLPGMANKCFQNTKNLSRLDTLLRRISILPVLGVIFLFFCFLLIINRHLFCNQKQQKRNRTKIAILLKKEHGFCSR